MTEIFVTFLKQTINIISLIRKITVIPKVICVATMVSMPGGTSKSVLLIMFGFFKDTTVYSDMLYKIELLMCGYLIYLVKKNTTQKKNIYIKTFLNSSNQQLYNSQNQQTAERTL